MTDSNNGHTLKGLTPAQVAELLGKSRTRNAYGDPLTTFVDSDEAAISVKDSFPMFAQKNVMTLYQGFRNAADKAQLSDTVSVKKIENDVYLFHNERVAALAG